MHVWTLLQHTMIVVSVLRRTTVHKEYVTPVLLSSVLFCLEINFWRSLRATTGLKKVLEIMKMNTHVTPSVNMV